MNIKEKQLKDISVKGTVVKTDKGSFLRKSYSKEMEVNVPLATKKDQHSLQNKQIDSSRLLKKSEGGISGGTELVNFKDGSHGYFKPTKSDPFVRKVASAQDQPNLNLDSYHLNNKNNEKLSLEDHSKFKEYKNGDGIKGRMMDREMAVTMLGKDLGMDHLPDTAIREVNSKIGSIASDLIEQHRGDHVQSITKNELTTGDEALAHIAKTDPKAGDKALFDFIIGNSDRHGGNFLHKVHKDGHSEMLGFDHGFTFPSSNSIQQMMDYSNQSKFDNAMKNVKFTDGMINNINKFIKSGNVKKISDFITDKIGKKESNAFNERISFIQKTVINGSARTTKEMGYRKERFMT